MTALASLRGSIKFLSLLFIAAITTAISAIPNSAQAAMTGYPSIDGLMISTISPEFPLLYGEQSPSESQEVLATASELIIGQPTPIQPFQVYSLDIMPAHLLLQNYMATVLPEIPGEAAASEEVAVAKPESIAATIFKMLMPVQNAYISSKFGWRHGRPHQGTDFAAPTGTPIKSVEAGKVIYAGWMNGYGKLIAVDHGNGLVTRYAHCSGIGVKVGQWVNKGSLIGRVGNTGRSTGPHLHFEVLANGVHKNPEQYLNRARTIVHAP